VDVIQVVLLLKDRKKLFGVLAILCAIMGTIVVVTYNALKTDARQRVNETLRAVAVLKEEQIELWLFDRLGDVSLQSKQSAHILRLANPAARGNSEVDRNSHYQLKNVQKVYEYLNIELFNAQGQRLDQVGWDVVSTSMLPPEWHEQILRTTGPQLVDFFATGNADHPVGLAVAATIRQKQTSDESNSPALGYIVMHVDPGQKLYSLIQNWPLPSETAEVLLVRRDDSDVVYLNELRHQRMPPLSLRMPISHTELPKLKAILHAHLEAEGIDYRGEPVFTDSLAVRNTPWYLVTKIDQAEVFATLRLSLLLTISLIFMMMLVVGMILLVRYRGQQQDAALLVAEKAREHANELAQREARLRDFSECSADWFWETDAEHRFSYFSTNAGAEMGVPIDSLIGCTRSQVALKNGLNPPELFAAHNEVLARREPFRNFEYCLLNARGEKTYMAVSGLPIVDAAGNFAGYRGVAQVITARRMIEHELERYRSNLEHLIEERTAELALGEARTRSILKTMHDGLLHVDAHGTVLMINDAALSIFGYSNASELIGKDMGCLMPDTYRQTHHGRMREYQPNTDSTVVGQRRAVEGLRKNGQVFPLELSVNALLDDQGLTYIGAIRDLTRQVEAETEREAARRDAEQLAQAKSDFLANMSHEIRTPMNAIIGMAELCLAADPSPRQRNYLDKIQTASEALLAVLNEILDFSKIDAGKLELEHIPFILESVFDQLTSITSLTASQSGIELSYDIEDDSRLLVGDPGRLGQVLTNLVTNAIKFSSGGNITVKVATVTAGAEKTTL
jgi:PAS domain S-box-containing protein